MRTVLWLAIAVIAGTAAACNRAPSESKSVAARPTPPALPEPASAPEQPADPVWDGLDLTSIQLDQTLLVVKGSKGVAGCTYLNIDTFERTGEVCVIIPAADFDGMLDAKVSAVTSPAKALGIEVGMPGREALERLR